eukprot:3586773-Prymnesium_polylepis.1
MSLHAISFGGVIVPSESIRMYLNETSRSSPFATITNGSTAAVIARTHLTFAGFTKRSPPSYCGSR